MSLSGSAIQKPESDSDRPRLGIIGGSGLCELPELEARQTVKPETKYGQVSDEILIGNLGRCSVAFLPRHGRKHTLPPHKVPYKANLAALKALGVTHVIGTCIAGSLQKQVVPGSLMIPDQFVNLTWGRDDHFAEDGSFLHLPMGEPYCVALRNLLCKSAASVGSPLIKTGTVAVIQGPRFSTAAESRWFSANGWDIVNMTQYPECYFARELGLCYAVVAAVTDYDVGLKESLTMNPEAMSAILEIFRTNIQKSWEVLKRCAENHAEGFSCSCASTLLRAYYEQM